MKRKLVYLALFLSFNAPIFSDGVDAEMTLGQRELYRAFLNNIEKELIDIQLTGDEDKILKDLNIKYEFNTDARKAIRDLAAYFNIPTEWIYKLIKLESGGNPQAVNKQKGDPKDPLKRIALGRAVGTFQCMPSTAKNLGTTTEKLYSMTTAEQIPYFKKYLEGINPSRKFSTYHDLYFAVFFPKAIAQFDDYILGSHRTINYIKAVANQNPGFDLNKDNQLTKQEVMTALDNKT